ncbi:fungal-specific transcription factor domain-containing protein [Xylariaceae sp. FL0016]|nr:fungal-specific transcription factor domain-containing protein [Xylariaceae sp. FL0016]
MATPRSHTRDRSLNGGDVGPETAQSSPEGPDQSMGTSEERRPSKRRRIAIACGACRSKKSRCDGQRPKCSSCQAQNIDCVYAQTPLPSTTPVPKAFLHFMETRLASLESDVRQLKQQGTGSISQETPEKRLSSYTIEYPGPGDDLLDSGVSPDATDGVGSIEFTDEVDSGYYGPSSNIAFTRIIRRALGRRLAEREDIRGPNANAVRSSQAILHVSRPQSPKPRTQEYLANGKSGQESLKIPPAAETEALVEHFFGDTAALFPYVHQKCFAKTYEDVKSSNFTRFRRSWLGILNMVLAMATITKADPASNASDRAARAEVFFDRARSLCLNQLTGGASVENVQVMLLMSQYLQGTHRSVQTWNIHGLAVKAAFQLGLHSEEALMTVPSLEREIRKRTWFACVILDRSLSMTFGRPSAIPDHYIRLPLPKICASLIPDGETDSDEAKSTRFFVSTITLYKIMGMVLDTMFGSNIGAGSGVDVLTIASNILQLEHKFLEWLSSLPQSLGIITPEEVAADDEYSLTKRLRVILTLRYHNLRMLAHRPILDKYLEATGRDSVDDSEHATLRQVGWRSKNTSVQSAAALIGIVRNITMASGPKRRLLGASWFTLYFTLNAALTIIAVLLSDHQTKEAAICDSMGMSETALQASLDQAITILPLIDAGNGTIEKCAKFTANLRHYLNLLRCSAHVESSSEPSSIAQMPDSNARPDMASFNMPIDLSHIDSGLETGSFLASLEPDFMNSLFDTDLFC